MVTRIYKCVKCGEFEVKQSIKDDPIKFCRCGEPVRQLYSPEPLKDVWMTDSPFVTNGVIHRYLQKGGRSNPWNTRG